MNRLVLLLSALVAALAFAQPAVGRPDDARLDTLFQLLQGTRDDAVAQRAEAEIWSIWLEHPGGDVLDLMKEGVRNLHAERFEQALADFDRVVATAPDYAEGWNKRANAHYLLGHYDAAVADIRTALSLEPRHFAALAGLGLVYLALDRPDGALKAFEGALAINPHLKGVRAQAADLRTALLGDAL
ncbi:tetratricopeptide repeat protein [Azospirillum sp. A39]|uniref:tetratricopeptide repeat protein n=1 Tax=Azospirillum sp. A39 TaxID=3462279 RepID=UPI0040465DA5